MARVLIKVWNMFQIFDFLEASEIDSSALNSFKLIKLQIIDLKSLCFFKKWIKQLRLVHISRLIVKIV